jgi:hypothetical protein
MITSFFITEFWTGPDGKRQLSFSEATPEDPTEALRDFAELRLGEGWESHLLIITFPILAYVKD